MASFNPAPDTLADVVTPDWLSQMLAPRWPGAHVRDVEIVEVQATQATKARLALTVDGGGSDVPARICIKGVLTDTGAVPAASIVETMFYREGAAQIPVRVPECIHASLNAKASRGVIVMRDVIAAGGAFGTALEPFTPEQTLDGLDQLARLHVATWEGTSSFDTPWVSNFLDQISRRPVMPPDMLQNLLDGPRGAALPPAIRDATRLQAALKRLATAVSKGPRCFVHGDAHAGNVYRQSDGRLGLVDWQILQKGNWAQDVAYHLAAVLLPEDRRTHERALLDAYRDRLKALGGPELAPDGAWQSYRVATVYGYFLWAITRKVEPEITNEFVRRLGTAVDDLKAFDLLDV